MDAYVMGRLNIDLFVDPIETKLSEDCVFVRALGGFAGNVATGLARLGVKVGVISRVGDDGHGLFARRALESEGIDTSQVTVDPYWPTPLAFVESWPPEHFPITYYRRPTATDLIMKTEHIDLDRVLSSKLLYVSGTGLCEQPSIDTTLDVMRRHENTTILDLDYRESLWPDLSTYRQRMKQASSYADVVIGNEQEVAAAALDETNTPLFIVKSGRAGSTVYNDGQSKSIPSIAVNVINGLGAGDAFAAALGYGLLNGIDHETTARRGNLAGALVASRPACSTAMPYLKELDTLCRDNPWTYQQRSS